MTSIACRYGTYNFLSSSLSLMNEVFSRETNAISSTLSKVLNSGLEEEKLSFNMISTIKH